MEPVKVLLSRLIILNDFKLYKVGGIMPKIRLFDRLIFARLDKLPIEKGSLPLRLWLDKFRLITLQFIRLP